MSDGTAVPVGAILTGDELTLTFDRPEFDSHVTVGYTEVRDSGITDNPEGETLIQRLERWARDREYDFVRNIRPGYVEGFRDAQSVALGLIQAWEELQGEPSDAMVEAAARAFAAYQGFRYPGTLKETWDGMARVALRAAGVTAENQQHEIDRLNELLARNHRAYLGVQGIDPDSAGGVR